MKLSIFTRIGGKYNVRSKIVEFFPKDYDRYIEPFLGGGQVFLELEKKDNVEYILNDKNKDISTHWRHSCTVSVRKSPFGLYKKRDCLVAQKERVERKGILCGAEITLEEAIQLHKCLGEYLIKLK